MITAVFTTFVLLASAQSTPAPFVVLNPEGAQVQGPQVLTGERRLVVYVAPSLDPAGRLVEALRRWSDTSAAAWGERLVLIVAAPPADARAWLQARWGDGQLPSWFADPDASGWRALGFDGTLGVAGASRGVVEWKLDGVIADPATLEQPIRAWIEGAGQ
jgi:hypothetical protein